MLTLEVRRRPGTGAEMHRITGPSATVGASSGNEVVVRARGVYGRHLRLLEKDGAYHLDLFRGISAVQVNGREFLGGAIAPGDRITIGEATITVVEAAPSMRPTPIGEMPSGDTAVPPSVMTAAAAPPMPVVPVTEVEYRTLRLAAFRLCREARAAEDLAMELTDFLDREFPPSEWAVGEFSAIAGFRPIASTFRENPALPPQMGQDIRAGERLARSESVTGVLTLIVEPSLDGAGCAGILVRESPRLAARAILFVEELAQLAGVAFAGLVRGTGAEPAVRQTQEVPVAAPPAAAPEASPAEIVLRSTDDLKKIVETVEREVIDRAMRRVEGNQSRGAQVLNISRGSLIAKLKEFAIPDYRYMRRERGRRG
jgi:Bacterial regulatory protein, Fis family